MKARLLAAALYLIVAACGRRTREDPDAFRWEEQLPAGATLHVRNTAGGIEVVAAEDSLTHVNGTTRWSHGRGDAVRYMSSRDGSDVYICAVWGRNGRCDAKEYRSSRPGHSWLDALSLFRRRSDAVANFTVEVPPGIRIDASTMSGEVHVEGATAGVTAKTMNGGIEIENSAGPTVAQTMNGSVRVSLDSIGDNEPLRLETVNGSVTAEVPSTIQGEVRLSSVNGRVESDFDIVSDGRSSKQSLRGRIGESSRQILLKSTNGGVELRKRDESDADHDESQVEPVAPAPPTPPTPSRARPRARR